MRLIHFTLAETLTPEAPASGQCNGPGLFKPMGLWVSDEDAEDTWSQFCRAEMPQRISGHNAFEVRLVEGALVRLISSSTELLAFDREFRISRPGGFSEGIDWRWVANVYDGVLITPYCWEQRLALLWYYGWDVASGCIWNPAAIASVTRVEVPATQESVDA